MRRCLIGLLLVLAACAPTPQVPPSPTPLSLQGRVDILTPSLGWIIYDEALSLSGTAEGLPAEGFRLTVTTAEGALLLDTAIRPAADGRWSGRYLHGYTGEPTEITLVAASLNPSISADYATTSAALAGLDYRPEGRSARISSPSAGQVVGGESLLIEGTSSGYAAGALSLHLLTAQGEVLSEIDIALPGSPLDEVVWRAELPSGGVAQPALLRLLAREGDEEQTLEEIPLQLSVAAG